MIDKKLWCKKFQIFLSEHIETIFHGLILCALTIYILCNWNRCISMQFFSKFNGNNILFFIWIALLFLMLYDVEAKGVRFKKRKLKENYDIINLQHELNARLQTIEQTSNTLSTNLGEESTINGSSN